MKDNDDKIYVVMVVVFVAMIAWALLGDGSSVDPRCEKWKGRSQISCMGGVAK